jgi:molybdate/tungstate transport system substrate-binding protein
LRERRRPTLTAAAALATAGALTALALAGCGSATETGGAPATGGPTSTSGTSPTGGTTSTRAADKGAVSALYAGSLEDFIEEDLGPAFTKATGFGFEGFGGGSEELVAQLKGGVRRGDVFLSAAPSADAELQGKSNGDRVSWYSTLAVSALVLGYNPHTALGRELARGVPWYEAIARQGVLVGRTDPKLDPKGRLTVEAIDAAAGRLRDSALTRALKGFPVFPETALVGRLQSGQMEAGFFYAVEAAAAKFPTVSLAPIDRYAQYTITILEGQTDPRGSEAFVRYLLSPQRAGELKRSGLVAIKPQFHGSSASVPAGLRSDVGAG